MSALSRVQSKHRRFSLSIFGHYYGTMGHISPILVWAIIFTQKSSPTEGEKVTHTNIVDQFFCVQVWISPLIEHFFAEHQTAFLKAIFKFKLCMNHPDYNLTLGGGAQSSPYPLQNCSKILHLCLLEQISEVKLIKFRL